MGLCKCPKKKVTNLFCFEHRVNVCENCLVSNHSKCVVQSYLQWLQDSDYNPNCTLCNRLLSDEECGECVRLLCYDVYHWTCLNAYAHQLPGNTAPAGYTCPGCSAAVFPASNQVSPVADALRKTLSQVNWARAGLGLPLIDEPPPQPTAPPKLEQTIPTQLPNGPNGRSVIQHADVPQQANSQTVSSTPFYESSRVIGTQHASTPVTGHSVVNIDEGAPFSRIEKPNPRKLFDARDDSRLNTSYDHDENKYERRSAFNFLSIFSRSRSSQNRKEPGSTYKKFLMVLVIGLIGLVTVVIIFSKMGRSATMSDPLLDPLANPNIRIERNPGNVM